jgi:hypothetical protein
MLAEFIVDTPECLSSHLPKQIHFVVAPLLLDDSVPGDNTVCTLKGRNLVGKKIALKEYLLLSHLLLLFSYSSLV